MDVERVGSSGRADADEPQSMLRGLGGKPGGELGNELVEGDPAARCFGFKPGLRVGGKIECHSHRVDCSSRETAPEFVAKTGWRSISAVDRDAATQA